MKNNNDFNTSNDQYRYLRVLNLAISWMLESDKAEDIDFAFDFAKWCLYKLEDEHKTYIKRVRRCKT